MFIHEYGNPEDETILLLHPMEITEQDLYEIFSEHLKGHYYIIAPDQGGHGDSSTYLSADQEAESLKQALRKKGKTHIRLLYGASMGVAVGYRLMMDPSFTIDKIWFYGVALHKNAWIADIGMRRMFLKKARKLRKDPTQKARHLIQSYGPRFGQIMKENFIKMSDTDIIHICWACCHYDLTPLSEDLQNKIHLEYGQKDPDYLLSKKGLRTYWPKVKPVLRKEMGHCEYMAWHTKAYVEEIEEYIRGK